MVALIPVIFAVAGALVYALSANAKASEIGRLIFVAAFLVVMFAAAGHSVRLF
jgi:hypothetical protein